MTEPTSLYLHIPFCTTKCTYCAFNTYTNMEALVPAFVDALIAEIGWVGRGRPGQTAGTIFFGGGTPSLLTPQQFTRIMDAIREHFTVLPNAEVTLEANPNDVDTDYLSALRAAGINRISIGMQSAIPGELALFARRHTNDAIPRAVTAVRRAGFASLNLDLIYGTPGQTLESWQATLEAALAMQPQHVSLYALGLEEGTPLKKRVDRGEVAAPDDDLAADMYDLATDMLGGRGYSQYEISNWAKPGHESRHNLQYWYNLPYLGLGPGAHGFANGVRYSTVLGPAQYIRAMEDATSIAMDAFAYPRTPAVRESTQLDTTSEIAETLIMGLRLTQHGIDRGVFRQRFGVDLVDLHRPVIEKYAVYGLLEVSDERVRITSAGRMLSNMIFRELV